MNVFGTSERSWRKARKRAVSPIIATILLVAITVVLAAVLYVLISGLTHGPGGTPIGSAFTVENPVAGVCPTGDTVATNGCLAAHYTYTMTIETSTVTFGSVLFEVKNSAGTVVTAAGVPAFAVLSIGGGVAAYDVIGTGAAIAMTGTWSNYPTATYCAGGTLQCASGSTLSSTFSVIIDMGTANPAGQGYSFVALGTGSYGGTTAPVGLP